MQSEFVVIAEEAYDRMHRLTQLYLDQLPTFNVINVKISFSKFQSFNNYTCDFRDKNCGLILITHYLMEVYTFRVSCRSSAIEMYEWLYLVKMSYDPPINRSIGFINPTDFAIAAILTKCNAKRC